MFYHIEKAFEKTTPYFLGILLALHASLFFIFIGVVYINPNLVETVSNSVRLFVSMFLIIRFNPLRKYVLHKYDGQVIFTAALFLLTNEAISKYILSTRNNAEKSIIKIGRTSHDNSENQFIPSNNTTHI
jgi:hypothetical protein